MLALAILLATQARHPLGLSFFRDPLIPYDVYDVCEKQLAKVSIAAIAGRPNGDQVECWNLKGQRLTAEYAAVPAGIRSKLTRSTIAICVDKPLNLNQSEYPFTKILLEEQQAVQSSGYLSLWKIVDTENLQTVDVLFDVRTQNDVATIALKKGQKLVLDRHRFEVTDVRAAASKNEFEAVSVRMDKPKALCTYSVRIAFDRDLYFREHPKATTDTTMISPSITMHQSDDDIEVQMIGEYPSRYWAGVSIIRSATLQAWMGQIPTRPTRRQ